MEIRQFFDNALAHSSYAVVDNGEMVLIDPARDPQPYYEFAGKREARITAVVETHPHADFVSSHMQINEEKNATIYASKLVGADYPHQSLDEGEYIRVGEGRLVAIHTPGHSPDSISLMLHDGDGVERAVFTGDSLFVGDVGRPDLRESAGSLKARREELAKDMYHTLRNKFMPLRDDIYVYPAHGAGSLCGKNMSSDTYSTIGREKKQNWALKKMSEKKFVKELLQDQPFIPAYFSYDVDLNKKGAPSLGATVTKVLRLESVKEIPADALVVDVRSEEEFAKGHLPGSINLMEAEGNKFETWLGSVIDPHEYFFMLAGSEEQLKRGINRAAKIGYEGNMHGAVVVSESLPAKKQLLAVDHFEKHLSEYTIVDVRNPSEVAEKKIFEDALEIPLYDLRSRALEVPTDKPVVVHCAAGFRSAAGSSILQKKLQTTVYDLGEKVKKY